MTTYFKSFEKEMDENKARISAASYRLASLN